MQGRSENKILRLFNDDTERMDYVSKMTIFTESPRPCLPKVLDHITGSPIAYSKEYSLLTGERLTYYSENVTQLIGHPRCEATLANKREGITIE